MNISFVGKRALVTGAAGGIGKAITGLLTRGGAKVIAADVRGDELQKLYEGREDVIPMACDLTDWDGTRAAVGNVLPVDLLVNNAGVIAMKKFKNVDLRLIDKHVDIHVKAAVNISQVVIENMIARNVNGAIVNITSVATGGGGLGITAYAAAKAALASLTDNMALEFGPSGIRVNNVQPGFVQTPMLKPFVGSQEMVKKLKDKLPLGRIIDPEDVAAAVAFLLSDHASNITGSTLLVDGGMLCNALN